MPRPDTKEEYIKRLKIIYASFAAKDLSEQEFIRQMLELADPKKIMDDLGDIQLRKGREQLNRMRIKSAIS